MNNLTTRKIVLGLLMVLVLAFSVQGTADAITLLDRVSGDLQLPVLPDGAFSVTFSAALQDQATVNANYQAVPSNHAAVQGLTGSYYYDSSLYYVSAVAPIPNTNNLSALTSRDVISEANAFHYNEEAVTISVSGALITTAGGSSITPDRSHPLTEDDGLENNNIVTCVASGAGEVTITITDATPRGDLPGGTSDHATAIAFTVYVVEPVWRVNRTAILSLRNLTNGVADGYFDGNDQPIYSGDRSHYEVMYTVTPNTGDGGVYVKKGNRLSHDTPQKSLRASSGAAVYLSMGGATRTVTVKVNGTDGDAVSEGLYIYGNPTLDTRALTNTNQGGNPGEVLQDAFTATVQDGSSRPDLVEGVPVKFEVKDKGITSGGTLIPIATTTIVDARNVEITSPTPGSIIYVRTGNNGAATINFQLGSASGEQLVDVSAVGFTKTIKATTTFSQATRTISVHANRGNSGNPNIFDLTALVENGGEPDPGEIVTFRETLGSGTLTNSPTTSIIDGTADTAAQQGGKQVTDVTDVLGRAQVAYDTGGNTGRAEVKASISVLADDGVTTTHLREIAFSIRGGSTTTGGGGGGGDDDDEDDEDEEEEEEEETETLPGSLSIDVAGTGATRSVTVTAATAQNRNVVGLDVRLRGTALPGGQQTVRSGAATPITLPTAPGNYELEAAATGFATVTETITVTTGAPALPAGSQVGTLTISKDGAQVGTQQPILVRATPAPSRNLAFTVTTGNFSVGTGVILTTGTGRTAITVPTTGLYFLTVSADGYTSAQSGFTAGAQTPDTPDTTTDDAPEPSSIEISGSATHSGTLNTELDDPLRVRVLDADDEAVADARVVFRVRTGQGRLSRRGSGRGVAAETDSRGYAGVDYTPLSARSTVSASVSGVPEAVTFTITTDGAAPAATPTPGDPTPSTTINPVVHVAAAQRPPMLWVDGGAIYALVGASPQRFAPGVDNALNLTVGGGKVYWTEKTGESGGTINSANLNGSGVTELASIFATPMGIAVDVTNSTLYWTNSRGRIQSANLDGSGITNVIPGGLEGAMDIALAGGNAYWTQGGNVRFVNLRGTKQIRNISTGNGYGWESRNWWR